MEAVGMAEVLNGFLASINVETSELRAGIGRSALGAQVAIPIYQG